MKWIGVALLAGSLLIPPLFAGDFYVNLASQILIAAIFALSLNLLVGFGGMTSLGHASGLPPTFPHCSRAAMVSDMARPLSSRSPAQLRLRRFSASSRSALPGSASS
jgi:hypothetical protein